MARKFMLGGGAVASILVVLGVACFSLRSNSSLLATISQKADFAYISKPIAAQTRSAAAVADPNRSSGFLSAQILGTQPNPNEANLTPADSSNSVNSTLLDDVSKASSNWTLPPLDSILTGQWNITGDPQPLLDFAIIGHAKCGTSTMMKYLGNHPEIKCFQEEIRDLTFGRPADLIRRIYKEMPDGPYKRGFKNPADIEVFHTLTIFREYWPKTKLIVGIRHPVRWFESLYNFRVQNYNTMPPATELIGPCTRGRKGTCTHKGEFHVHLAKLGKTNRTTIGQQEGLDSPRYAYRIKRVPEYVPNKVFLFEISQLSDSNETRASLVRKDLQNYLGLREGFPPPMRYKPGRKYGNKDIQAEKDSRKIDICDPNLGRLREELMTIARDSSVWIRKYFLQSEDVIVSSREYFVELLEGWMRDPCSTAVKEVA